MRALILGVGILLNGASLFANPPAGCHCKNCACTLEQHCGCYSEEGCHCGKNPQLPCGGGKKPAVEKKETVSQKT